MSMTEQSQHVRRSEVLQARRLALVARSRLQRQQLIWQGAELHHELRFIELGLRAAQAVRASPLLIAVLSAGLTILKPRRALWLVKTGLTSWRLWQKFEPLFGPLVRSYLDSRIDPPSKSPNHTDEAI